MTAVDIIKSWMPYAPEYGVADVLRSAAMQVQDDCPQIGRNDFVEAAGVLGYNVKTAARCWAFVAAQ